MSSEDKLEYYSNNMFFCVFSILGIFSFIGFVVSLRFDLLLISVGMSGLSISFFFENKKIRRDLKEKNKAIGRNKGSLADGQYGEKER